MIKPGAAVAVVAALVSLSACSGGSAPQHPRTPTPSPTTSATTPAAQQLQRLAGLGARLSYAATYRAHLSRPATTATWRVWRTRAALRLDIVQTHSVTTLIVSPRGAFSCRRAGHEHRCFRVAKPGRPIPSPFDYSPHTLFSTDLDQLARDAGAYDVTTAPSRPAAGRVPAASCFGIRPLASTPKPRVPRGVYCLSASGLLTAVTYPSGNTVRLVSAALRPPPAARFVPYASPTPLPG